MPSSAWIAAAKRTDREQVLLMAIESVNAIQPMLTTQADWQASKAFANVNFVSEPGSVICGTDSAETASGDYTSPATVGDSHTGTYQITATIAVDSSSVVATGNPDHPYSINYNQLTIELWGSLNGGAPQKIADAITVYNGTTSGARNYTIATNEIAMGLWSDIHPVVTSITQKAGATIFAGPAYPVSASTVSHIDLYQVHYLAGSIQTASVDLGLVPNLPSVLSVDKYLPAATSIAITARGSDDGAAWSDLGAVSDGSSLPAHHYYDFAVSLGPSPDGLSTPELYEIRVSGGNSQYVYIGTHEDVPLPGVRPLLLNSLGAANSKLDLMKLGSTGEVTPKMFYVKESFELLRDGYLRDKAVTIKLGFVGLAEADYAPIFSGLWYDAVINPYQGTVDIKTRTIFSRFSKVQIPAEISGLRNSQTVPPKVFAQVNIISAMLDIISYLGVQERWVDLASANALMAGPRSGSDWLVSRTLDKDNKESALTLLEELSVLSGVDILQQPDGKITFHLYDPAEANQVDIPAELATFDPVQMGQAELYTRQQIYYEPRHVNDLQAGSVVGCWAVGVAYAAGDSIPTASDLTWHALVAHTSVAENEPGAGINWTGFWAPSWQAGNSYQTGDKTWTAGQVYTALSDHTSSAANAPGTAGSAWGTGTALPLATVYGNWALGLAVSRNMSIKYGGAIYFCLNDHTTDASNCPTTGTWWRAYWTTAWLSGTSYIAGDVRISRGPLYTCKFAHTSSADTEPGHGLHWRDYWTCQPAQSGSSAEDFYNVLVQVNSAAELAWGLNQDVSTKDSDYLTNPGYSKMWYDKWAASDTALQVLASRMDRWFANPRSKSKASNLPPQFWGINLGGMVGVSGLVLPSYGAQWGVPCSNKKFRVMSKSLDPAKCTVSFDLLEVGTAAAVTGVNPAQLRGGIVLNALQLVFAAGNPFADGATIEVEGVGAGIDGSYSALRIDGQTAELSGLLLTAPVWSGGGTAYLMEV